MNKKQGLTLLSDLNEMTERAIFSERKRIREEVEKMIDNSDIMESSIYWSRVGWNDALNYVIKLLEEE